MAATEAAAMPLTAETTTAATTGQSSLPPSSQQPTALSATAATPTPTPTVSEAVLPARLPRVAIQFCTQCKWMLRAAYFAQELLSTFGNTLGEVALQPATGGVFRVTISSSVGDSTATTTTLWDRAVDGGFPETKELKRRVRDVVSPGRDLGHVDRHHKPKTAAPEPAQTAAASASTSAPAPTAAPLLDHRNKDEPAAPICEDCQ